MSSRDSSLPKKANKMQAIVKQNGSIDTAARTYASKNPASDSKIMGLNGSSTAGKNVPDSPMNSNVSVLYVIALQGYLLKAATIHALGTDKYSWRGTTTTFSGIPSILASVLCIIIPSRTAALIGSGCAAIAYLEAHANDGIFDNAGFFDMWGLAVLSWTLLASLRMKDGPAMDALLPTLRIIWILHYFFAGFAKLNSGWFDDQTSCTTAFVVKIFDRLKFTQAFEEPWAPWTRFLTQIAPAVIAAWELLAGLLFAVPCLRPAGVICVLTLHIGLSPIVFTYACPMAWMLTLWAPRAAHDSLRFMTVSPAAKAVNIILCAVLASLYFSGQRGDKLMNPTERVFYVLFYPLFMFGVIRACLASSSGHKELTSASLSFPAKTAWWQRGPMYFAIAAFVLNGSAPYLGIKTHSTWSMFSNLRVENGISNHFFVPVSFQIFDELRDIVYVNSTDFMTLKTFHQIAWGDTGSASSIAFARKYQLDTHLSNNWPKFETTSGAIAAEMAKCSEEGSIKNSKSFGGCAGHDDNANFAITRTTLVRLVSWDGLVRNPRATFFVNFWDNGRDARFQVANGTVLHDDAGLAKLQPFWKRNLLWSRTYQPHLQKRCGF